MVLAQNLLEYGLLDVAASAILGATNWLTGAFNYNRNTLTTIAIIAVVTLLAMKLFSTRP
jgi:hypothetical protein